jgi:hypothetical protein
MTTFHRETAHMPRVRPGIHIGIGASAMLLALMLALPAADAPAAGADKPGAPAKIEAIPGTKLKRLTLTEKAAKRLDIQTGEIRQDGSGRKTAPYPAVVYDLAGEAWVYTSPAPLTFVRQKIVIEQVKGELAFLREGPPEGTKVATVGIAELYGAEQGVGH